MIKKCPHCGEPEHITNDCHVSYTASGAPTPPRHLFDVPTAIGACGNDEGPFAFSIRDVTCAECLRAAPGAAAGSRPLLHQLNLSAIRRWVDEGFEKWTRASGQQVPNGYAGEAAAAVWVHVQEIVAQSAAGSPLALEARILELATEAARAKHCRWKEGTKKAIAAGHVGASYSCSHSDCALAARLRAGRHA